MTFTNNPLQWSAQFGPSLTNSFDTQSQHNFDTGTKSSEGPSRLRRSPIPPDPGYGDDPLRGRCVNSRIARVRGSDAKGIYKRAIANTGAPFRLDVRCSTSMDIKSTTGKPPKNYMNENLKRIRRIMRESQKRQSMKKEPEQTPVKATWSLKQFDNVQSKVKQSLQENSQRSGSRPQSAQSNFLRAHARTGPQHLRTQSACDVHQASVDSSVNLETKQTDNKTKPNYIKINSQYAKTMPKLRKAVKEEATEKAREKIEKELKIYQEHKGCVPNYLEKMKEKRNQELQQLRKNAPDPECPPGHVTVENEERKLTLAKLEASRTELEKKLCHLPIRNDSVKLRRTKDDIEKKLVGLDEAIKIFSKPKVFIKMDE